MVKSSPSVLVVEDDPEINQLVGAYVEIAGFGYHCALDGQSALRMARADPPALVVLDIMLPDLDGFEVCRRLRAMPSTARVPVILLSAVDRPEHRQKGQICGAVAYLTKPFDPDRLIETIKQAASGNGHP
ncbi:MAG: response regulator [Phycisphaerales bacterium]|nr:response regulator [Phycisphaerales bacterium]